MLNIKDITLNVADSLRNKIDGISHMQSNQGLVRFAEALIAEVAKQNEPVMVLFQNKDTGRTTSIEPQRASDFGRINKRWINCGPLFSFPPTAEQIANETAEAIAKMLEFDTVDPEAIRNGAWKEFK